MLSKSSAPYVPYIGILLTDLTYIDDGNDTFLDNEKETINYIKSKMNADTISVIIRGKFFVKQLPPKSS